jgi:hypothetical protein
VTQREEAIEARWPRFAWSRTPARPAMVGGGGRTDRFGYTLAKTEARAGAMARAAQGGAVCGRPQAEAVQ